ncbi:Hypothetical predicted protein [Lecanosticta acicola]|uniref:Uncharacterized protein n=1 Tax=Lecanosticta acicola TaxID=111012 RepID=A0AAI8YZF4_9PEZI|nr:Hypothetical predicted protein [Lecanosticta acicola]
MPSLPLSTSLFLSIFVFSVANAQDCSTTCESFGVDFVDGGSYFQNIESTNPFTAFEEFQGCQNDTADNILVDPSGTQYECNLTQMQPSDSQQLVTCPINKDQLVSGNWSMIVISNNGQCQPIDYVRQFSLSVGEQSTVSVGPTVTFTSTTTPISSTIVTSTITLESPAPPVITTANGGRAQATVTVIPGPVVTIVTKGVYTYVQTSQIADIVATSTITNSEPCQPTANQPFAFNAIQQPALKIPDRVNRDIFPTVGPHAFLKTPTSRVKRALMERRQVVEVRNAIAKRHPDSPTTTIVDNNIPASTTTSIITGSTQHVTGTTTILRTVTTTPTVTVARGQPVTTVTASGFTFTQYFFVPVETSTVYHTSQVTASVTKTVSAC